MSRFESFKILLSSTLKHRFVSKISMYKLNFVEMIRHTIFCWEILDVGIFPGEIRGGKFFPV